MKLIKRIPIEGGSYQDVVLTESVYDDELRSRGRFAATQEGIQNLVWIYPLRRNGEPFSVQLLYADGQQTHYSIQP